MKRLMKRLEDLMAAIAFAEAGEHDTALEILGEQKKAGRRKRTVCGCAY